jgi:hypothetical protein
MALHRDIYWVGRQWTVTGYGLQAVDQKQKGKFDIEASRLWEEGLLEGLRAEKWLNPDDFEKAIAVARKRFLEPPSRPGSLQEKAGSVEEIGADSKETTSNESPRPAAEPVAQAFDMRIENAPAKFVRQWRVRIRR